MREVLQTQEVTLNDTGDPPTQSLYQGVLLLPGNGSERGGKQPHSREAPV